MTAAALPRAQEPVLRALVDDYRDRCLWFLARDYYPRTTAEALRVLDAIQRHGQAGRFFLDAPIDLRKALGRGEIAFHPGSIRGAFPRLVC